jgi:hypothetical protein
VSVGFAVCLTDPKVDCKFSLPFGYGRLCAHQNRSIIAAYANAESDSLATRKPPTGLPCNAGKAGSSPSLLSYPTPLPGGNGDA